MRAPVGCRRSWITTRHWPYWATRPVVWARKSWSEVSREPTSGPVAAPDSDIGRWLVVAGRHAGCCRRWGAGSRRPAVPAGGGIDHGATASDAVDAARRRAGRAGEDGIDSRPGQRPAKKGGIYRGDRKSVV